ncbi:MAG: hypothetical protein IKM57_01220, partial [Paludibacteraceae bacterium]|nr:hypothetical protein [Paludibacteraceae bacterium]
MLYEGSLLLVLNRVSLVYVTNGERGVFCTPRLIKRKKSIGYFLLSFLIILFFIYGLITMFLGALLALFSVNFKRTLACSSVSQIGFI